MFGDKEKNGHYYGSDTHKYINDMIRSTKKMYVISPYIDNYYAQIIANRSPATEFYIISSSLENDAKRRLVGSSQLLPILLSMVLSFMVLYLELMLGLRGYALLTCAMPLVFSMISGLAKSRSMRGIHLKVPKQFVHAKMYIADKQAISGSVNMTYKGTHSNVEHIEITRNAQEVEMLREQFWKLWKKY